MSIDFIKSLEDWIKEEKAILEMSKAVKFEEKDRLTLVLALQSAFAQISKIAKGFQNWLQNPYVVAILDQEILKKTTEETWEVMKKLLEIDIEHTSHYIELVKKGAQPKDLLLPEQKKQEGSQFYF
jgi:hypothetical protein